MRPSVAADTAEICLLTIRTDAPHYVDIVSTRTPGVPGGVEREVRVREVEEVAGRSGTTRFVLHDDEGNEYTTFRARVGEQARRFAGRRAVISFHEEERRGFHNVYLDSISPAPQASQRDDGGSAVSGSDDARRADEAAWDTALEAAPWIVGTPEPEEAVEPEELYARLHPFKELVADDIRESGSSDKES